MADKKISDLTAAASVAAADLVEIENVAGNSRKVEARLLASAAQTAVYEDQKAANTAGGTPTAGAWTARTLNTEVYDDIGLTLSSNQLSLAAGTYDVEAWSVIYRGGASRLRLRDVTNNVTLALSVNTFISNNTSDGDMPIPMHGRFTLAGTATVELQYRVATAQATTGLGNVSNYGEVEVYSRLKLTKIS